MERLQYRKFKGLEIRCLKCGKSIQRDHSTYNGCKHPIERTVYRAVIILPESNGKRETVTLKARTYDEAIKELIDFRTDVLNGINKKTIEIKKQQPQLLIECMAMYLDFLADVDIPDHQKKNNSNGYINSVISLFEKFKKFIHEKGLNIETLKIGDIDDKLIGSYYTFLLGCTSSSYTFNHHVKAMRAVYAFLISKKGYLIRNPFLEIKLKAEKGTNTTISTKDFKELFEKITPEDSIQKRGKEDKEMYKDWLIDAIKLKAFTGRRNEEIFTMKWNMIYFENDKPIYIESPNLKNNRLQNKILPDEQEYTYIPIIKELEDFLIEKGLFEKQTFDEYIINAEGVSRKTMEEQASKSFTFFSKKLNRNYNLNMGQLRSTYITAQEIYALRQGQKIQQHSDFKITNKHYINQKEIAKFITKDRSENQFRVFE